ncbi:NADP-dependent oxidoreductase [Sinomonas humi]|uniref:NADP-dependent oxidoreductase n=1 Tax=Sinomonas humi TaxID=1338436 RepID=UPI0038B4BF4A
MRIRVGGIAVSPTDTSFRSSPARHPEGSKPPFIPGMDAAGVVDEVGPESRWKVGDEVMAIALPNSQHGGAYVEYLVAPDDSIARIPGNTSIEEAATIPMNGLTATQILELLDLKPGQTLAVTGAAGTLGNYVIQLAKNAGLRVIGDSAEKDRELVESLGTDYVVARGDAVAQHIREIVPEGVDGLVDTALLHEKVVPAVKDGRVFVSVRGWKGDGARGIRFEAASVRAEYLAHSKLEALREAVEQGILTPRVAAVLPADQAPEAHRRLEAGGTRGRFVLKF